MSITCIWTRSAAEDKTANGTISASKAVIERKSAGLFVTCADYKAVLSQDDMAMLELVPGQTFSRTTQVAWRALAIMRLSTLTPAGEGSPEDRATAR